jgi:TPR repeat protein
MVLRTKFLILLSPLSLVAFSLHAQTQAFKRDRPKPQPPLVLPSMLDYHAGRAVAQHELGVRHLIGKGFQADTLKAFEWIRKAAEQGLPLAQFNLGILYMNGFGTPWNPFKAFNNYRAAAEGGVPEASYMLGVAFSEDFIVPRSWSVAYGYFQQAGDRGYAPAQRAAAEIKRRKLDQAVPPDVVKSAKASKASSAPRMAIDTSFSLLFVDFTTDTAATVGDTTLLKDAVRSLERDESDRDEQPIAVDSNLVVRIVEAAQYGNPEAWCMLGRFYERGTGMPRDLLRAAEAYIRAVRVDSPRAAGLLWNLVRSDGFNRDLKAQTDIRNPAASFVWSGLTSLKFSDVLSPEQAVRLLDEAAGKGHEASMIELGLCAMTGRWMDQDRGRAIEVWTRAASSGSLEAQIRLAITTILGNPTEVLVGPAIALLDSSVLHGSVIAEAALAYCAEHGIGMRQDVGEAYRIYHRTMIRGSEPSFLALKRMHDALRPADKEFQKTSQ